MCKKRAVEPDRLGRKRSEEGGNNGYSLPLCGAHLESRGGVLAAKVSDFGSNLLKCP